MDATHNVIPRSGSREAAGRSTDHGLGIKILAALSLSVAVYGMAAWIYIAVCSLVVPDTLPLPLTHLLPFLREDTSGVLSFILSFFSFAIYQMVREKLWCSSKLAAMRLLLGTLCESTCLGFGPDWTAPGDLGGSDPWKDAKSYKHSGSSLGSSVSAVKMVFEIRDQDGKATASSPE